MTRAQPESCRQLPVEKGNALVYSYSLRGAVCRAIDLSAQYDFTQIQRTQHGVDNAPFHSLVSVVMDPPCVEILVCWPCLINANVLLFTESIGT